MVEKGKSSLKIEKRSLVATYAWKGVNKVLNTSIFKTSFKGKSGDKDHHFVKKTYGMLLESAGNSTIKIGKNFPEHLLKQDFINRVRGKYNRIIQEENNKIKDEFHKFQRIQQIKKEKIDVIKRLERLGFEGKINNLNNWLDRKCPVCGETAIVIPEMGAEGQKVFRCGNQHQFTAEKNQTEDEEIWDHMPGWAQMFKHI